MRKPRPRLSPVHTCLFETSVKALGQPRRLPAWVGEDEHADRSSLLVADGLEKKRCRYGRFLAQDALDWLERFARLVSQECECDVEARRRPTPSLCATGICSCRFRSCARTAEMALSPDDELSDHVGRKLESEKEPESVISLDGSDSTHRDGVRIPTIAERGGARRLSRVP